jgi:hypothetical protein
MRALNDIRNDVAKLSGIVVQYCKTAMQYCIVPRVFPAAKRPKIFNAIVIK